MWNDIAHYETASYFEAYMSPKSKPGNARMCCVCVIHMVFSEEE